MPVQSIELLLDDTTEEWIRSEWRTLAAAHLPGLRETARPHVTLTVAQEIWPRIDQQLRHIPFTPFPVRIGTLAIFTRRRSDTGVLVRIVVPSAELLALQAAVHQVVACCPGQATNTRPGEWTPHVTLARRFPVRSFAVAAEQLSPAQFSGRAVAVRHWDGVKREDWLVSDG
ncbi:MAG: 2'-5' RNA ligase family protein [Nocardiaceae bacterium]|nr:2'-5' RNA ligase family protein [Nocardiaceae bacterium]